MTEDEALVKLYALIEALNAERQASIALKEALHAQTQAIYMLASALAEDDDEPVSPYQSLSEPPLSNA